MTSRIVVIGFPSAKSGKAVVANMSSIQGFLAPSHNVCAPDSAVGLLGLVQVIKPNSSKHAVILGFT